MSDWRYNDERMQLRANSFIALKKYNTLKNVRPLTNSATSGYLKGNNPQKESKTLFLDTEKTVAIREGSIVSVPEVLGGKPLEGRVIFIGDKPTRGLDGRKLSRYFTVYTITDPNL